MADDNGAYRQYGNKIKHYTIIEENFLNVEFVPKNKTNKKTENLHVVFKSFYRSISNQMLTRKTYRIKCINDPSSFDKIVIVYVNKNENFHVLKCHGNSSKINKPYFRKTATALDIIKKESVKSGSASIKFGLMLSQALEYVSLSEIPSSVDQLYKHKSLSLNRNSRNIRSGDEYADALINRQKSKYFILISSSHSKKFFSYN